MVDPKGWNSIKQSKDYKMFIATVLFFARRKLMQIHFKKHIS